MQRFTPFAGLAALVVAIATSLLSLLPLFGEHWWVTELFDHFRPHYAFMLLLCLPFLLLRFRYVGSLVLLPLAFNLASILPLYLPAVAVAGCSGISQKDTDEVINTTLELIGELLAQDRGLIRRLRILSSPERSAAQRRAYRSLS
jgi:hypothetical protein